MIYNQIVTWTAFAILAMFILCIYGKIKAPVGWVLVLSCPFPVCLLSFAFYILFLVFCIYEKNEATVCWCPPPILPTFSGNLHNPDWPTNLISYTCYRGNGVYNVDGDAS